MNIRQLKYLAIATLFPLSCFAKEVEIPLNPLREYDFKNRDYIFKVRKETIQKNPILNIKNYNPIASSVFRQVEDGKPWWGIDGLNCYGTGQVSISGLSEESRFIDNPYILVAIDQSGAINLIKTSEKCPLTFPRVTSLTYDSDKRVFRVKYNVSAYYKTIRNLALSHRIADPNIGLNLSGRNALDLGYPYVYARSATNIKFTETNDLMQNVYQFKDFIHVGGSCGYQGGCNNGSPHQPPLEFRVQKLPAKIILKLWKNKPASKDDKSDLIYIIDIS